MTSLDLYINIYSCLYDMYDNFFMQNKCFELTETFSKEPHSSIAYGSLSSEFLSTVVVNFNDINLFFNMCVDLDISQLLLD